MPDIILSTLNARYIHASLGLRYLKANMGELEDATQILEFTINQRTEGIVEDILRLNPKIVGLGIYIWNTVETCRVIAQIKTLRPDIVVVIGGPEVSYEFEEQEIVKLADYLITGLADLAFARLCESILERDNTKEKVIIANPEPLPFLKMPYEYYTDEDVRNRVLYVEASRGCPFKCEFCLSSLDKTAWPFDLNLFLEQMQALFDRGARHFKFVDRTFNLKINTSIKILQFFLEKLKDHELFLHFELIPDRLPDALKELLIQFPAGSLQFEIGVQSFNTEVQALISRKQDNQKTCDNISWIRQNTQAHIHADLIFGLPGESITSFAVGFNKLYELNPHEIQLGILKRLRGTPIARHTIDYDMRYNPLPPYNILSTLDVDFQQMQLFTRLARYWDLIANSGRFKESSQLVLSDSPFDSFLKVTESIYAQCGQTHQIALKRLYSYLYNAMTESLKISPEIAERAISSDYSNSGLKGWFTANIDKNIAAQEQTSQKAQSRQKRHISKEQNKISA